MLLIQVISVLEQKWLIIINFVSTSILNIGAQQILQLVYMIMPGDITLYNISRNHHFYTKAYNLSTNQQHLLHHLHLPGKVVSLLLHQVTLQFQLQARSIC